MKKQKLLLIILATAFAFSSCQNRTSKNAQTILPTATIVSPTLSLSPTPDPNSDSPIRKIDFQNFAFSETKDYPDFKLKNVEKSFEQGKEDGLVLEDTQFADLTGDGNEEAILKISIQTGGSAIPNLIYIYALKNAKPKPLWSFMTGDRAEGGFKSVYAESNKLIVELFGNVKFIESKNEFEFQSEKDLKIGLCCPDSFSKFRFKWNGKKFELTGERKLFNYDRKNSK